MERPVLGDPAVYPSEELLAAHLGEARHAFLALRDHVRAAVPDALEEWNYYADGKSWLFKATQKKKTIFWLSASDGFFRTTFYIAAKHERSVMESGLPDGLKRQYAEAAGKKIRGITVTLRAEEDLAAFKEALALKLSTR